ncbi:MAG: hypothetical protein PHU42_01635 [Patescibacteria group bacterium]|nr:hypothetical protein [Patescibacteria group bacterium]
MFITKVGKILSRQKNPDRYTLVSIFKPDSQQQKDHGTIYMIIEILSSDPTMGRVAKVIEKILIEKYYENLEDGLTSFEATLKIINEKLASLADEGEIGWIGKINAVIAILEKNILHVTQTGTTEAYMVRGSTITHITENLSSASEKPNPLKTFINIASGELDLGDKVIISTSELFYHFSLDDLRRINAKFPPAIAAAYIVKMLRKEEIESINTLILELDESDSETEGNIGKKIFTQGEQKIVEQYEKKFIPFWKFFLRFSKKGLERSKEVYGNKVVPGISRFAQEANKKVNEKLEKKDIPLLRKSKADRELFGLVPELVKSAKTNKDKKSERSDEPEVNLFQLQRKTAPSFISKIFKFIARQAKEKNQVFIIAGILLLVLLATSGLISYQKRSAAAKKTQIEQAYNSLKTKVESAIKANELGDSKKAQSLLTEAQSDAANFPSSSYLKTEVLALEKEINDSMEKIFNIQRFDSTNSLINFTALDPTIKLTNVMRIGNTVYVIDKERHKAATYNLEAKTTESLQNLSYDGVIEKIALLSDKSSAALLASGPANLYIYNSKTNSTQQATQIGGTAWPEAVAIASYMNNIYLLAPNDNQIFKYTSLVGSYSTRNNYILDTISLDLKDAVDLAIDGSVYILMKNGDALKFISGQKMEFGFTGLPNNVNADQKDPNAKMVNPIRIITNVDMANLYVADAGAKRVVVFDKDGKYKTQFVSNQWNDMKDIAVSWENKKLYVLSGTEVFEVDISK